MLTYWKIVVPGPERKFEGDIPVPGDRMVMHVVTYGTGEIFACLCQVGHDHDAKDTRPLKGRDYEQGD
jgi:hypothetical protein